MAAHSGHGHRESFAVPCGEAFLEAHEHDQAMTVSVAICPEEGASIVFEELVEALRSIASGIEATGGIVGHVKAFARQDGAFAHASATEAGREPDCEGDVSFAFGFDADIQFVAIALLLGQDELISLCKSALVNA
ncbi:MAG: hypothetical protein IJI68_09845 [Eggerthellaceae bacterium]|nr:hypothetical protein [Eggerthellaceae bacterium]